MIINRVTMLGHKDHGKSTLIGSMLIVTKSASEERINEAKSQSKDLGRKFEPGFILDSFSDERKGGLTIDTSRAQVKYRDSAFEFIDVPGHEELIKNMISGASYASFALLMVSAKADEGIRQQTKRHVFLAKMLGISKLIVAVNKMDTVKYSQERFEAIRKELGEFFENVGIPRNSVYFVPISAYNLDNLAKKSAKMKWYKGKALLEIMRDVTKSKDRTAKGEATRMIVQGSMAHGTDTLLLGKVASGVLKSGSSIRVMPIGSNAKVVSLFVKGSKKSSAKVGENVAVRLDKKINADPKGLVIYGAGANAARSTRKFSALIFVVKKLGNNFTIKFNGAEIKGKMKARHTVDTTSGMKKASAGNRELNAVEAEITTDRPIPAEPFNSSNELGRFVVYQGKEFSGIGIINSVS